jgi:hypothetical protein
MPVIQALPAFIPSSRHVERLSAQSLYAAPSSLSCQTTGCRCLFERNVMSAATVGTASMVISIYSKGTLVMTASDFVANVNAPQGWGGVVNNLEVGG